MFSLIVVARLLPRADKLTKNDVRSIRLLNASQPPQRAANSAMCVAVSFGRQAVGPFLAEIIVCGTARQLSANSEPRYNPINKPGIRESAPPKSVEIDASPVIIRYCI